MNVINANHFGPIVLKSLDLGLDQLVKNVPDAIVVVDVESGAIVLWNPAAEATFGYTESDVLGCSIDIILPGRSKEQHRAGFARYLRTGHGSFINRGRAVELSALTKAGNAIIVELSASAIED